MVNRLLSKGLCSHCKNFRVIERFTLCRGCYKLPQVRYKYRPKDDDGKPLSSNEGKIHNKLHTNINNPPLPPPTDYLPGTMGKFVELCWRAENGYSLWNPKDARGS